MCAFLFRLNRKIVSFNNFLVQKKEPALKIDSLKCFFDVHNMASKLFLTHSCELILLPDNNMMDVTEYISRLVRFHWKHYDL